MNALLRNGGAAALAGAAAIMVYLGSAPEGIASPQEAQEVKVIKIEPASQPAEAVLEEEAVEILKRSTEFLASSVSFRVIAETGFDAVQDSGQRIEFGARRSITVRRPNRARMEFGRRDGVSGMMILDGSNMWVYNKGENIYATAPQVGDISASIDHAVQELGVAAPLGDFIAGDISATFASKLVSGFIVGDSNIGGVPCDHLAFRTDYLDYQIWIAQGKKPLPQRLVITYREEEGAPQFWAQFLKWEMALSVLGSDFTFTPPAGAEQIRFAAGEIAEPAIEIEIEEDKQ